MRDLYRSPLFRLLVCLVLICSLLINLSPIRAKATSVVAGLTITELLTLLTMVVAGGAGVYWTFENFQQATDTIGVHIIDQIYIDEEGPGDEGALEELTDWYNHMDDWNTDGSGGSNHDLGVKLARALLGYIAAFVGASIVTGGLTAEEEVENYTIYDAGETVEYEFRGYTYSLTSDCPFIILGFRVYCVDNNYWNHKFMVASKNHLSVTYKRNGTYYNRSCYYNSTYGVYLIELGGFYGENGPYAMDVPFPVYDIETDSSNMSNVMDEICCQLLVNDGKLLTPIAPSYVGDIPDQIQNGDYTDEEKEELLLAPLPEYLDITKVMQSPATAYEDYLALQQKVLNGELTPQEALNQMSGESTGTGTDPSEPTETPEEDPEVSLGLSDLTLDLSDYFPFCIPFDLYDFFACLNADPVAPVIAWQIPVPGGEPYPLELDLSVFDEVAQLLRRLQLLLFCVGLAFKTRDLIKG